MSARVVSQVVPGRDCGPEITRLAPSLTRTLARSSHNRVGAMLALLLLFIAVCGPLIASDRPIICKHEGRLRLPAVVEALRRLPLVARLIDPCRPFALPGFDAKADLPSEAFAIWPVIDFGPLEMTDAVLATPSPAHWLGTDDQGRDVAARVVRAAAVSIKVGLGATVLSTLIGVTIGALAGVYRRWPDWLLSRVIEVMMCFPVAFAVLALAAWGGASVEMLVLIIGLTRWTTVARLVRAELLRLRDAEFVLAARSYGASSGRILFSHLLPVAMTPVWAVVAFAVADAVLIEAALSWLGFGVQVPHPSWGNMLRDAFEHIRTAPHLLYPPAVALISLVIACHLIAEGMRSRVSPRTLAALADRKVTIHAA